MLAAAPKAGASPNTPPTFSGSTTNLSVYRGAGATDFSALVNVSDADSGQTLMWSNPSAPTHGTVVSGATATSNGALVPPGGTMTYMPAAGYAGADSFVIQVSDGIATAQRTIFVTVDNTTGTNGSLSPFPVDNRQPTAGTTWVIAKQGVFPSANGSGAAYDGPYMGELRFVSFTSGVFNANAWVPCNGQLLPINQNQALFSLLSTTYGGDGRVNFALPDLRGRTPVGMGQGDGLTQRGWGDKGGKESFTLTTANLPAHRHSILTGNTGLAGSGTPVDNMQPWQAVNFCVVTTADADSYLGWVRAFAFNFTPAGFHAADGALLSVENNSALFNQIGNAFGGDGTNTFAVPDFRGRTPIGTEGTHVLGEKGGSEQIVLTTPEIPPHAHTYSAGTTGITGGGLPHDTMQPYLALKADISLYGIFGGSDVQPSVGELRFSANTEWGLDEGWLPCDGSLQPISEEETLFNLIGTTYGGDGQETFALPDFRDRAVANVGQGSGLTGYQLGELWGNATQSIVLAQLPAHSHTFNFDSTDISLLHNSVNQSAGINGIVGSLSTADADSGDSHSYSLISGTGSANNSLFDIFGSNLIATNAATMLPGMYSVRIQTDDGNGSTFQKAFTVTVVDDVAPAPPTAFSAVATGNNVALSWINPLDTDFSSVIFNRSLVAFPASILDGTIVAVGLTGTSQADNNLADGTYYYSIFAVDHSGNYSIAAHATILIDITPPTITSTLTANGSYGSAFNYSITANDSPVTFSAAGLPGGLNLNTNTGTILGTATETGLFDVVLGASDSHGNVGNATLAVNIAKVNATVSLGGLSQAYNSGGHSVSKTTTPDGLAVNTTYNGLSAAPTNAGSYTVVAIIADANYAGTATNTLIIVPATAAVLLSDLSQTYDGIGKSASASTTPSGLTVNLTYAGSPDAPTNAGSYAVVGTVTNSNYTGSVTNTLVIARLGAAVVLSDLNQTYDGTGKSASASTTPNGLTVNLTYTGSPDAPTNFGDYLVVGTISDINYQGSATNTLTIATRLLSVTADDKTRAYGETNPVLTGTITGTAVGDDFTASYTTMATPTSLSGGNYAIVPSLIDGADKAGNYTITTNNGTLTITTLPLALQLAAYSTNQGPVDPCHPFPMDAARISLSGEAGRTYTILVSTNMSDWSALTNLTSDTNGVLEFIDSELQQHQARFFRGVMQ